LQTSSSGPVPAPAVRKPDWRARLPFFYGWVIVGSIFANFTFIYGVYYSFSVYFVALLEEFGWSRAETAGVYSVFLIVMGVCGLVSGALLDRLGPSRMMPAGGILLAVGLAATSRITQLWEFYLYFGVFTAAAFSLTAWVVCVTTISRWFSTKQGVAVGFASAGIGLATVLMVPFSQYLISSVGWRTAYLVLAVVALLGVVPQTALLQVGRPEDLGLKADGRSADGRVGVSPRPSREMKVVDAAWVARPWTLGTAVRTARFWLLTAAISLAVFAQQVIFVHQAAFLVDGGYDKMVAASAVGLVGFLSIFGKVALGELGDRIGRERTYTGAAVALSLGVLLLMLARVVPSTLILVVYAVVFAGGYAATSSVVFPSTADVFAGKNFGSIYGAVGLGQGVASALGAWAAGYIFDVTGSYIAAFGMAMLASMLSCVCLWIAAPRLVRRVVRRKAISGRV
jgi:MFS family permease